MRSRRGTVVVLAALAAAFAGGAAASPRAETQAARAGATDGRYLVVRPAGPAPLALLDRPGGRVLARLARNRFGGPLALAVVRRSGPYLGVSTDLLPNGRLAWVDSRAHVLVDSVDVSLRVSLGRRTLGVYLAGRLARSFRVGIGAPSSPTPTGRFAVAEKLPGTPPSVWGCCILGLTAHQPRPPAGWNPTALWLIALHGGGSVGQATSAGCVHLTDAALRYLMRVVPVGTPVFIRQ